MDVLTRDAIEAAELHFVQISTNLAILRTDLTSEPQMADAIGLVENFAAWAADKLASATGSGRP